MCELQENCEGIKQKADTMGGTKSIPPHFTLGGGAKGKCRL